MVDISLASLGRAMGVGAVLIQMVDHVSAPNQMPPQAPVRKGNDVRCLIGQECEGDDECFVTLATRHRPLDQPLPKQLENAVIEGAREVHPSVEPDRSGLWV